MSCPAPLVRALCLSLCGAPLAYAEFEEVRILRADPVQTQACPAPTPAGAAAPAPAPQPQQAASPGVSGREILGGVAGAAVGGLLGNQVGRGTGRTAATVGGAAVGGFAGYKLAEEKPKPQPTPPSQAQGTAPCTIATQYRVQYARTNGMQGEVIMSSQPTSQALMINFCGDRPCN